MNENLHYISYGDIALIYNSDNNTFCVENKGKTVLKDCRFTELQECAKVKIEHPYEKENNLFNITYSKENKEIICKLKLNKNGAFFTSSEPLMLCGEAYWGENIREDTFAMSTNANNGILRCAIGPATSTKDNCLYDRNTDSAFITNGKIRFKYNYDNNCYDFSVCVSEEDINFFVKENVIADKYKIDFGRINKNGIYKKPPAGFMTWYAVKFDACEEKVLENTEFQEKHLKKYGADTVWVDWEWYHKDMKGFREDGVNTFNPDKEKYPHGLKYVSDKIKEAGFVPALWLGFTNDVAQNEYTKENPEIILVEKQQWCGRYFYDFSHPKYLNEFLPMALQNVFNWGYEAVKFDTIPNSIIYHEEYHMNMYNPHLTTKEAFRGVIEKLRNTLGENMYMLSCAASRDLDLLWAVDIFDAARVGDDIFKWDEFINNAVNRVIKFYSLHNIVLYTDPDNVVLREEFNTYNQAATRIYFVSLLGLPLTFGDEFKALSDDRLNLIKRCLPVMDVHPMDIASIDSPDGSLLINLAVESPLESYNVLNVMNLKEEKINKKVDFSELSLGCGEYHIFDFVKEEYLGIAKEGFDINLSEFESRVLSIRRNIKRPQILSTSRHITQGYAEIRELVQLEKTIKISADLVSEEDYRIYLYVPNNYKITDNSRGKTEKISDDVCCITYKACEDREYDFVIEFEKLC